VQEPPPVTITDPARRSGAARDEVVAGPDDADLRAAGGGRAAGRPRVPRGPWALLAAALAGFALAQLLPSGPADEPARPRLALVVGGEPVLDAQPGLDPITSAEVVLVNTGSRPVRLTGAVAEGLGLRWSTDRELGAGEQVVAVLREGDACARVARQRAGPRPRQQLRVTVRPAGADRPEEVVLPLPVSLVSRYEAFARSFCGAPPVERALDVITEAQSVGAGEVLVTVGLVSRTVERLRLVEVQPTVPGLTVELRDPAGTVLDLPLLLEERPVDLDLREVDRYVLGVRTGPNACLLLQHTATGDDLVQLFWVAEDEPSRVAATLVGDLSAAVRDACR
jgi:hypothetical protein